MPKAFECTRDIVISVLSNKSSGLHKVDAVMVAEYFETVYNKINEIEENMLK